MDARGEREKSPVSLQKSHTYPHKEKSHTCPHQAKSPISPRKHRAEVRGGLGERGNSGGGCGVMGGGGGHSKSSDEEGEEEGTVENGAELWAWKRARGMPHLSKETCVDMKSDLQFCTPLSIFMYRSHLEVFLHTSSGTPYVTKYIYTYVCSSQFI